MQRRSVLKFLGVSGLGLVAGGSQGEVGGLAVQPLAALNQVGYLPRGEKVATVAGDAGGEFQVLAETGGHAVFHGSLSGALTDEASGDRVVLADFSKVVVPGMYRLAVGPKRSERFMISKDVYRDALRLTMRSYYGQRCGCAVDMGNGYKHAACHLAGAYHASSGKSGTMKSTGGWHDAGDYGRYVVNGGLSTGTLLWAWEMFPQAMHDLKLDIPESGGKVPDVLAEVRWNLDWMLSMQDGDGGVWHKQTSEQFCDFVMPEEDALTSYVIGTGDAPYKSTCATGDLAAVAAIAARCYAPYDGAYAAKCLTAAKRAWAWAVAHPDVMFKNPKGVGTGEYGDEDGRDEILWASAELWRTTGDAEYEKAFLAGAKMLPPDKELWVPSWPGVASMAYWTYLRAGLLSGRQVSGELKKQILERTRSAAETLVARQKLSGYGNTLGDADFTWGSNSVAANQSLLLLMAHAFHGEASWREAARGNLHYLLGRNCFGVSWVTQVGSNPYQHPHHRPSGADSIAAPWPGLLSGGPNGRHPGDDVARTFPKMPPMRMWADDQRAYSMNEVAINWNAPLVFLLAAAQAG
jgi:endoglucanase